MRKIIQSAATLAISIALSGCGPFHPGPTPPTPWRPSNKLSLWNLPEIPKVGGVVRYSYGSGAYELYSNEIADAYVPIQGATFVNESIDFTNKADLDAAASFVAKFAPSFTVNSQHSKELKLSATGMSVYTVGPRQTFIGVMQNMDHVSARDPNHNTVFDQLNEQKLYAKNPPSDAYYVITEVYSSQSLTYDTTFTNEFKAGAKAGDDKIASASANADLAHNGTINLSSDKPMAVFVKLERVFVGEKDGELHYGGEFGKPTID